jgi:hypothetical protein
MQLSQQPRLKLLLGILEVEAQKPHPTHNVTIGEVAVWNEYGTPDTPARSWLRDYVDENADLFAKQLGADTMRVIFAKENERKALSQRGSEYRKKMIGRIKRRIDPPNAPETLRRKRGNVPLIDTGTFIENLRWQVK